MLVEVVSHSFIIDMFSRQLGKLGNDIVDSLHGHDVRICERFALNIKVVTSVVEVLQNS